MRLSIGKSISFGPSLPVISGLSPNSLIPKYLAVLPSVATFFFTYDEKSYVVPKKESICEKIALSLVNGSWCQMKGIHD